MKVSLINAMLASLLLHRNGFLLVSGEKDTLASNSETFEWIVDFVQGQEQEGRTYLENEQLSGKLQIIKFLDVLGDARINATTAVVSDLQNQPFVVAVDQDFEMHLLGWVDEYQPYKDDNLRGRKLVEETPYGIDMVRAAEVPPLPANLSWKKVCVVDTGYENSHSDLPTLSNDAGFNPYTSGSWDVDGNGHGTHCAGTIGAIGHNNEGVDSVMNTYGSGFNNFFIGKGLTDTGSGTFANVIEAMNKCGEKGASIISMSLGGGGFSAAFNDAAKALWEQGVLLVAAAGNGGSSELSYPASYEYVMSVASVTSSRTRSSFSQYNSQVEIAAPGSSVLSTYKGGILRTLSGTSMATPHVAGVAGLVWSHFPTCSPGQIRYVLSLTSVHPTSGTRCDNFYGHGIVDAKAAYDYLADHPCDGWANSFPPSFVQSGCYVPSNATPYPTSSPVSHPTSSPVSYPTSSPESRPTSPPTNCRDWCTIIDVPWKSTDPNELQKCNWHVYCSGCVQCQCKTWCSTIPVTDMPWNAVGSEEDKCGTLSSFCGGCSECFEG